MDEGEDGRSIVDPDPEDIVPAESESDSLPIFACGSSILYPRINASFDIRHFHENTGIGAALKRDRIFLAVYATKLFPSGSPGEKYHSIATRARILHCIPGPEGSARVIVEGLDLARIRKFDEAAENAVFNGFSRENPSPEAERDTEQEAQVRQLRAAFETFAKASASVSPELLSLAEKADDIHGLCDFVLSALPSPFAKKYALLVQPEAFKRLRKLIALVERETGIAEFQKSLSAKVKSRIERSQREYFLTEKLKEIHKELGRDAEENESLAMEKTLEAKSPPAEILERVRKELARLSRLQSLSPEAGVLRTYCEWLVELPWSIATADSRDIRRARAILDEDHYGLARPKERILEFIAVRQLSEKARGPIICLVGPPGTGKTSLGRSIARALDRKFLRVSLGGLRDEAEIRGHRRTYIGALPGKIIQSLKKAGSSNPVFLLDEVDKMSSDFRGDPASALLEVLDPEQNSAFSDHYLEVPCDLSRVMFIMTANSVQGIPPALLDRMEIIEIPGYGEREKLEIAMRHLIPKQLRLAGLASARIRFRTDAILEIIRRYTMESGVRGLERELASVLRKLAGLALRQKPAPEGKEIDLSSFSYIASAGKIRALLGPERRHAERGPGAPRPGLAYGLAWTQTGGTMLPVETIFFEGEETLLLTGNLGDVMKESARIALSHVRAHAREFGLSEADFKGRTIHIHVPEGAIPKDGPSAGITLAASLYSAFTGRCPRASTAMTGELTLTGDIAPVGGVREKFLAAIRNGIGTVLVPEGNRPDCGDLPREAARALSFHFISTIREAFDFLFSPVIDPDENSPQA